MRRLLLAVVVIPMTWSASGATLQTLPATAVDAAAIARIPAWQGRSATVLSHLDLSAPFKTRSQWTLVVLDDPHQAASGSSPVAVCFVHGRAAQCSEAKLSFGDPQFYWWRLDADRIVYAGSHRSRPLLWLKTFSGESVDGNGSIEATLYRYARRADRFERVFRYDTQGSNNNQDAVFVGHGPIAGDVITDYPTEDAPYTYWIEVYAPGRKGKYARVLRYRGHTGYADGNPLPVADSEMPEVLRRLGHWRPGDALPAGEALPVRPRIACTVPVLRHEEEWCR
ncbi:MAG TPA: hypothetical protein VF292_03305 [Rhodanobacteraceae bacterium]